MGSCYSTADQTLVNHRLTPTREVYTAIRYIEEHLYANETVLTYYNNVADIHKMYLEYSHSRYGELYNKIAMSRDVVMCYVLRRNNTIIDVTDKQRIFEHQITFLHELSMASEFSEYQDTHKFYAIKDRDYYLRYLVKKDLHIMLNILYNVEVTTLPHITTRCVISATPVQQGA